MILSRCGEYVLDAESAQNLAALSPYQQRRLVNWLEAGVIRKESK